MYIYIYLYLSMYLSIYQSFYPSIHLYIYTSIHLSIYPGQPGYDLPEGLVGAGGGARLHQGLPSLLDNNALILLAFVAMILETSVQL